MITSIDLFAPRSPGVPTKLATFSGAGKDATAGISIQLGNTLKTDPPGTKIFLVVNEIRRINFQNKPNTVAFDVADLIMGVIIK